jgi:hypothetical protein
MKLLFENWQKYLKENEDESDLRPKVVCNCLCTDCVFNENEQCIAEEIDLDFAQTAEGKTICECLTYKVREDRGDEQFRGTLHLPPMTEENLEES